MDRSSFLQSSLVLVSGFAAAPVFAFESTDINQDFDPALIEEFVTAGHGDLPTVKRLLNQTPNLLNARHDWGNGDFEEAIEGAAHVGNKELANYLIDAGARVNLFTLTMLGKDKIVLPAIEEYPALIQSKGAHGFSLLHHAKKGGPEAKSILDYLTQKGLITDRFELK